MHLALKKQSKKKVNSDVCSVWEYPLETDEIGGAVVELKGRYPDSGRAVNHESKEFAYILEGSCVIEIEGVGAKLEVGDMVLIDENERYFWDGNVKMLVVNVPEFDVKQHEYVD